MSGIKSVTMAAALVLTLVAMPLGVAGVVTDAGAQTQDEGDDSVKPGERLGGVVGTQEAEVAGEVDERAYGVKIAKAGSDGERADVVNETLEDVEDRIADLEERLAELEEARENDEISEGRYNAEVTKVAAEKRTAERLAEGAGATVAEHDLEEHGVDVDALDELRNNAAELGGEEVSEIARSIAGEEVGQSVADDREPGAPIDVPGDDHADDGEETPDGEEHTEETPEEDEETNESAPEEGTDERLDGE